MINERSRRLSGFSPGIPVSLADGREWWLPAPGEVIESEAPIDPEYAALVEGIAFAEDAVERGRAELALGIYLLNRNYRLVPGDFQTLLEAPPGTLQSAKVRAALHAVAEAHLPSHPAETPAPPWGHRWRGIIARFTGRTLGSHVDSAI